MAAPIIRLIISGGKKLAKNKQIKKYADSFWDNTKLHKKIMDRNKKARLKNQTPPKKDK
jgi:hypothetical protein